MTNQTNSTSLSNEDAALTRSTMKVDREINLEGVDLFEGEIEHRSCLLIMPASGDSILYYPFEK